MIAISMGFPIVVEYFGDIVDDTNECVSGAIVTGMNILLPSNPSTPIKDFFTFFIVDISHMKIRLSCHL